MTVRVRIAPSPTGFAHVGTAHTALFNWLFARHHGGAFIVRIEDTDRNRLVPGAVESVIELLHWLGLDPDEGPYAGGELGPYYQSERLDLYAREIERLIAAGCAYRCYCSPERLAAVNAEKQRLKQPPGYDRHCRYLGPAKQAESARAGGRPTVRLAVPLDGDTVVDDRIRGEIRFQNALLQDAVLMKSDGFPTYHFAATVDDHFMEITHVMRGDEWLPSTPLHLLIYRGLGWTPPEYFHLPLILGKDKAKLSKRHGDTAFSAFIEKGYLPDALFNYLGLLGWSLDDKTEFISREEFVAHFDERRIVKNPAVFDFDKLDWMNGEYIRRMPQELFAGKLLQRLQRDLPREVQPLLVPELIAPIAPLLQTRIKRFDEAAAWLGHFFEGAHLDYTRELLLGKAFAARSDEAIFALEEAKIELEDVEDWEHETILECLRKLAERRGLKFADFAALIRAAITGSKDSLPLTESMEILGKPVCLDRLQLAVERLRD